MFILCIGLWTIWRQHNPNDFSVPALTREEQADKALPQQQLEKAIVYTKHARERMVERSANDNEVRQTILSGVQAPAKNGKVKFEKLHNTSCEAGGRTYPRKKVEVVAVPKTNERVIVTVIADCKN